MNLSMTPPAEEFTFEDLTEVYRREQRNKTISEVRKDFYSAMRDCQEGLRRESERECATDQFSARSKLATNQFIKFQEKSAQVFEFRIGKILDMALRAAGGAKIDTARLTMEEQEMYNGVFDIISGRRAALLDGIRARPMEGEEPSLLQSAVPLTVAEAHREDVAPSPLPVPNTGIPPAHAEITSEVPLAVVSPVEKPPEGGRVVPSTDYVLVRILEDLPAFAGVGRNYRLVKEDLVSLPPAIAKALVARKKAVGVQTFPMVR
jgi:DNA replication factor GINS